MYYSANNVARYILGYYYFKKKSCCSNLKLQKILYFLQANHLVLTGKSLFEDKIEAENFGPVVRSVYDEYKIYGSGAIPFQFFKNNDNWNYQIYEKDSRLMNPLLDKLEKYSSTALLELIHNQTPWKKAYESYDDHIIKKEDLIDFFKEREEKS